MFKKKFVCLFIFGVILLISDNVSAANLKDAFKPQNANEKIGSPLNEAADAANYMALNDDRLSVMIGTIIQSALTLLGAIFIALMVYAGGLWMTAKGNEQQAEKAKNLITEAMIGLVIVVAAYAISYFVIKSVGSGNIKNLEDKSVPQEQNQ